ncbi:hypothetical protein BDD12DRAFT_809715 [Trichophaea hybrida]|nr:hypothetical protein BDD12DRAFT_809715 [Trichophaea hybrida]
MAQPMRRQLAQSRDRAQSIVESRNNLHGNYSNSGDVLLVARGEEVICTENDGDCTNNRLLEIISRLCHYTEEAEPRTFRGEEAYSMIDDLENIFEVISQKTPCWGPQGTRGPVSEDIKPLSKEDQRDIKRLRGILASFESIRMNASYRCWKEFLHIIFNRAKQTGKRNTDITISFDIVFRCYIGIF